MVRIAVGACVYLPRSVALCNLKVPFFWFRSDCVCNYTSGPEWNCLQLRSESYLLLWGRPLFQEFSLLSGKGGSMVLGTTGLQDQLKKPLNQQPVKLVRVFHLFFSTHIVLCFISMRRWSNKTLIWLFCLFCLFLQSTVKLLLSFEST